ncbi:unnamed protein product [Mytilus edulis]|uniref:Uncharacterized protein n=1 Tax=Mytilus edulis TaxID=6550 RepID=A0A8S3RG74_MYTED|nr:unnamed protein product [Mytilus edulis]
MEEEINMLDEIKEIRLIKEDDDETFDLWLPDKVEDLIKCLLEENDFVVEDNDVTTFDLRLDKAKHNLDNAKQQMELMVEENKSLKATIENKNKHILETENKAAKDAKAAFVLYTNSNNQLKDVIHQANKNHVKMQMEKDQLQEQLQKLTKIKNAEAKDQRKMIDHLKKKMAEVENENNKNAKTAERSHRRKNECKQQLKATLMQSEKERITSQRTIANLQNNIRTLNEELKEYKKKRTITELQTKIRNLFKELNDLKTRNVIFQQSLMGVLDNDITPAVDLGKYREDILTENQPTTTCTCNRMSRTTNVFNVNIVSSQVSFNENTEQEMRSLIAGNGQHPAIEEDN